VNPWLTVPASDYEGHMMAAGQLTALNEVFRAVYVQHRPRRLAILGCATGNGIEHVRSSITEEVIGVDVNAEYLDVARERFAGSDFKLSLLHADISQVRFEPASLDLVHAALVLEYSDPVPLLPKVARWLSPGGACCIVLQLPNERQPVVTPTRFASLRALASVVRLHEPEVIEALSTSAGLTPMRSWDVALPDDKRFHAGVFGKT
jgi:ubiquinone/menaquinone biosynthesis C-methylase UbiE